MKYDPSPSTMQCMTRDFLLEILIKSYLYETGFLLEKKNADDNEGNH